MTMNFSVATRDDITSDLRDRLNAALGSGANLHFFDGVKPADCETADDGVELIAMPCSATVFNTVVANQFTANAITMQAPIADGTATYWRLKSAGLSVVCQGLCADTPPSEIIFNTVAWVTSMVIAIDFLDFTLYLEGTS